VDDGDLLREHIGASPEEAHGCKLGTVHFSLLFLLQNKLPFPRLAWDIVATRVFRSQAGPV
jgi:hypothetical protein